MADNRIKNTSKTASAVKNGGHASSGGKAGSHNISQGRSKNSTVAKLWRVNKDQWNTNNISGGLMPTSWQEYPKHVYPDQDNLKNYVQVNNEEEERAALGGITIVREEDEHERLVTLAGVKGVQVDKRWGLPKLTKAIEDAGHDSSVNPFK